MKHPITHLVVFAGFAFALACAPKVRTPAYHLAEPAVTPGVLVASADTEQNSDGSSDIVAPEREEEVIEMVVGDMPAPDAEPEKEPEELAAVVPPKKQISLPAPSSSWISVPAESQADQAIVAMMLHPRGGGRMQVRKLKGSAPYDESIAWLGLSASNLEILAHKTAEQVGTERFTFQGWQGRRQMKGTAAIFLGKEATYLVVATCDKHIYDQHKRDFVRVFSEFKPD